MLLLYFTILTITHKHGDAGKYQSHMPAKGQALVGWKVLVFFPAVRGWFDGVIVQWHGGSTYTTFHEEDDFHEEWQLPDQELVFARACVDGSHIVRVKRNMHPKAA